MAGEIDTRLKPQAILNRIFDTVLNFLSVTDETGAIYVNSVGSVPKYAKIAASASGDNTLVAAVPGKKIRVIDYAFMAAGTVNAKFQSGASGTDLTGLFYMVANTGAAPGEAKYGYFETAAGALLNLNLSTNVAVGGHLTYIEV